MKVDLSLTSNRDYRPGRPVPVRALWHCLEALTLLNPLVTSYGLKAWILRAFGAEIGPRVVIKPRVHVKHPWRLQVGENSWIGEGVWIDNLVSVRIGRNVCISQGAYICTGNHDWQDPGMGLVAAPIVVEDGVWVGAFSRVAPGLTVGEQAVIALGSVLLSNAEAGGVYQGNPARRVSTRTLRSRPGPARRA
jgi:putative colanic acid biosynthesis acetyltransferase WcaF